MKGSKKNAFLNRGSFVGTPLGRNARARIWIAFLCFFVVLSVGAYFAVNLRRVHERIVAQESQAALQGLTGPKQIDEALRQHPSNKILQLIVMAIRTTDETRLASDKLKAEIEPGELSKDINLGTASRGDLEALRSNLKIAEANATTFAPRYAALSKTGRDKIEKYALSLYLEKDTVSRFLDGLDKRQEEAGTLTSRILSARADYYRAYGNYVAVLTGEFGSYKVVNGQFIFPLQRTVDRYNVAAQAMTAASKRVVELEEEATALMQAQQEDWAPLISGK